MLNGINMSLSSLPGFPDNCPTVRLSRIDQSEQGTFGKLTYNDFMVFTGELSDRNNQPNISCIPKGVYKFIWTFSNKFKRMMYLGQNIPNRDGIRIHSANLMGNESKGFKKQLNGCIALGQKFGFIDGQKALLLSKPAIRQFETLMNKQDFVLKIV